MILIKINGYVETWTCDILHDTDPKATLQPAELGAHLSFESLKYHRLCVFITHDEKS